MDPNVAKTKIGCITNRILNNTLYRTLKKNKKRATFTTMAKKAVTGVQTPS
jgi:hypothetical protein